MDTPAPTTTTTATAFNPFDPEFMRDPYPAYARLRADDPVHHAAQGFWVVSRYDDVSHVLRTPQTFSSTAMGAAALGNGVQIRSIINTDPPEHTRIRNLVNRAFTPRMVADLEPRIREITRALLARVLPQGSMDVVTDLAIPLPVTVIAEILGVDSERRDDFKRWSNAFIGQFSDPSPEAQVQINRDRQDFRDYFARAIDERRTSPRDDLISAVIRAGDADTDLSPDEILAFCMLLLIAGNETTTNLIGNAMLALLHHPDQLAAVRADPARIPNMVEEALRYDSPVQFLFRVTTEDAAVGGTTIPAGHPVIPVYASANRDDARYPQADRFDIDRDTRGHLAFGLGPHFCLGAPLARLEAKVAFEELFAATRDIRAASAPENRIRSMFLRGLATLPVTLAPAARA